MSHRKGFAPVTLKDVARKAGVSYQTVSRVINDQSYVKASTRERVLRVAKGLDYRPNRLAGSLRRKHSQAIGLVMSDIENVFFAEVVSGVEAEAVNRGYSVILTNSNEDVQREHQAVTTLVERRVDGMIIAPAEGNHEYLNAELPRSFPVVVINRLIEKIPFSAVLVDNQGGAYSATEYLIKEGHTRIGAVIGNLGLMTTRERLEGFRKALEAHGLACSPEWIRAGGLHPEGARQVALEILNARLRPTALFASSSKVTEGVMLALKDLGLRHGKDIGLIGFDSFSWASLFDPPLSVVAQPTYEIGRQAVGLLLDIIHGGIRRPRTIRLPTRLVIRTGNLSGPFDAPNTDPGR